MGVLIAVVVFWLIQDGRHTALNAHAAYLSGDCETALIHYQKVGRYPSLFGRFMAIFAQEEAECQAFTDAQVTESLEPQPAITAYEAFLDLYPDSPLTTPALAAIHRLYLGWAEESLEKEEYRLAITILEQAARDYPALESETEDRLLPAYLAWGQTLQKTGDIAEAATVYNELQSRYPEFSAEAQSALSNLDQFSANP